MLSLKFGNVIALWCCNGDVINDVSKHSNVVIQIDVILEGGSLLCHVPRAPFEGWWVGRIR